MKIGYERTSTYKQNMGALQDAPENADCHKIVTEIDNSGAGGKLIFNIFTAFTEFELDLIRERTLAGLKSARARRRLGGWKRISSGEKLKA